MKSIRQRKKLPDSTDFQYVSWDSEDYDFIIRKFGGAPHNNNGNKATSALRIGRVLGSPAEAVTGSPNEGTWWKIKGGDREAFNTINFDLLVAFCSVRILKDTLTMLYEINKM